MKQKLQVHAQLLYVIAVAWLAAAVGCFIRHTGTFALIFAALGTIHLIWAITVDIHETKNNK